MKIISKKILVITVVFIPLIVGLFSSHNIYQNIQASKGVRMGSYFDLSPMHLSVLKTLSSLGIKAATWRVFDYYAFSEQNMEKANQWLISAGEEPIKY